MHVAVLVNNYHFVFMASPVSPRAGNGSFASIRVHDCNDLHCIIVSPVYNGTFDIITVHVAVLVNNGHHLFMASPISPRAGSGPFPALQVFGVRPFVVL